MMNNRPYGAGLTTRQIVLHLAFAALVFVIVAAAPSVVEWLVFS